MHLCKCCVSSRPCRTRYRWLAAALLCGSLLPSSATAEAAFHLIAHRDAPVNNLTPTEVADIFLDRVPLTAIWHPIEPDDETLRQTFYNTLLDRSLKSIRAYWAKRVFTGRGRPPPVLNPTELLQTLVQDPHAISFIPASSGVPPCCKILLTLEPTP